MCRQSFRAGCWRAWIRGSVRVGSRLARRYVVGAYLELRLLVREDGIPTVWATTPPSPSNASRRASKPRPLTGGQAVARGVSRRGLAAVATGLPSTDTAPVRLPVSAADGERRGVAAAGAQVFVDDGLTGAVPPMAEQQG